jgi:phosphoribosylamine--glycine ligase
MVCHGPKDVDEALSRIDSGEFTAAAMRFLVEEFLEGEEASYIVLVDKKGHILPLASAQDHKAVYDGDRGPNTGGMGAYSPAPVLTPEVEKKVLSRIVRPTIKAMAKRGTPFFGFLYVGLMIDRNGNPFVVEFNVRLGDPETQPILARLKTDIVKIFIAAQEGRLDRIKPKWDPRAAVTVVIAENGYPDKNKYSTGHLVKGLKKAEALGAIIDHAGTELIGDKLITTSGRVINITGLGNDYAGAIKKTYAAVHKVQWGSEYYRADIGHRALNR